MPPLPDASRSVHSTPPQPWQEEISLDKGMPSKSRRVSVADGSSKVLPLEVANQIVSAVTARSLPKK